MKYFAIQTKNNFLNKEYKHTQNIKYYINLDSILSKDHCTMVQEQLASYILNNITFGLEQE